MATQRGRTSRSGRLGKREQRLYRYVNSSFLSHPTSSPQLSPPSLRSKAPAVEDETPATKDESSTKEKVVAAAAAVGGVGALGGVAAVASGAVNGAPKDAAAAVVAAEPAHTTAGSSFPHLIDFQKSFSPPQLLAHCTNDLPFTPQVSHMPPPPPHRTLPNSPVHWPAQPAPPPFPMRLPFPPPSPRPLRSQ